MHTELIAFILEKNNYMVALYVFGLVKFNWMSSLHISFAFNVVVTIIYIYDIRSCVR